MADTVTYTLKAVDRELWKKVKDLAFERRQTIEQVIVAAIEREVKESK